MIDVCLLGTGGMMPLPGRWLSALLLRCEGSTILFDCGEGTQISWRQTNWGFRSTDVIVLSHLHADHVAGLPGVLFMLAHSDRTNPVTIYGPPGTTDTVRALRTIAPLLPYPVTVHELRGGEDVTLPAGLTLRSLGVDHRTPCLAYRLHRPRAPRFDPERAQSLGIPVPLWRSLQQGETVEVDGRRIPASAVLGPERRGLTVVFITDTRPIPALVDLARDADLLVCEGMYGDPADLPRAIERKHMIFPEAAQIADAAGARRLWLTHFSPSMIDPGAHLPVAQAIFAQAEIGRPHRTLSLRFEDDERAM